MKNPYNVLGHILLVYYLFLLFLLGWEIHLHHEVLKHLILKLTQNVCELSLGLDTTELLCQQSPPVCETDEHAFNSLISSKMAL
jgi:hypothetical protein